MKDALVPMLILSQVQFSSSYKKCCNFDESVNNNYTCGKNLRYQILASNYNFAKNFESGYCADAYNQEFILFKSFKGRLQPSEKIEDEIFNKCCPLNFLYDPKTHACVEQWNKDIFINATFFKIGLPHCKIIVDYEIRDMNYTNTKSNYCIDKSTGDNFIIRICQKNYDICEKVMCVHKCCPDGQSFYNKGLCQDSFINGISTNFSSKINKVKDDFAIVHYYSCKLYPLFETRFSNFSLDDRGLFHSFDKITNRNNTFKFNEESYCIEHVNEKNNFMFFRCLPEPFIPIKFIFTRWAMLLSCICLIFTILIYVICGEFQKIFGKILISYCISLAVGYALLSYLSFNFKSSDLVCWILGFCSFYFMFTSFTWLNIMCFDIFVTFGSPLSARTFMVKEKNSKFFWYLLYAMGIPLILSLMALTYLLNVLAEFSKRNNQSGNCIFSKAAQGVYVDLIFSTIPLLILQISNIIFYVKTVRYCLKVKSQISKFNNTERLNHESFLYRLNQRFGLVTKLWFLMGVSFLFEVISSVYDFEKTPSIEMYIELIWDTLNSLQGLFIFIIFVCKVKIYAKLKEAMFGNPHSWNISFGKTINSS